MNKTEIISLWETALFLIFFLIILAVVIFSLTNVNLSLTYKGIQAVYEKDFNKAYEHFNKVLVKKPFDPRAHLNMALSYDGLKEPDKALKNYDIVSSGMLTGKSKSSVFFAYFNKGELYGRLGSLDKALENYQKALKFHYKEREIKKNIELLFQAQKSQAKNQQDQKENQDQENQAQKDQEEKKNSQQNQSENKKSQKEQDQKSSSQQNQKKESQEEGLSEIEQKAILREVEKQENKARSRLYRKQQIFGDKTKTDW